MTDSNDVSQPEIERRWQRRWAEDGLYEIDVSDASQPRLYCLAMLPYPSGNLHMGHWYVYGPSDTRARYLTMRGHRVFFPMGFDGFGLPAENAAIRQGVHPAEWTWSNIERMREQLRSMGTMIQWRYEAVTCDPAYYRWNQWFFLRFLERGLAYRKFAPVDWCPSCQTTLAREQVVGEQRLCERCDTPVIKKELDQWFFRITRYADELLDFGKMEWPERVELLQRNWIGRSEGAQIRIPVETAGAPGAEVEVFTTRPDTLWGATFFVLAPEHPLVARLASEERRGAVEAYVAQTARRTETERLAEGRERTGEFLGAHAVNPATGRRIPMWIADYVLPDYGSGAIMAVPAHDDRDFDFAGRHGLPVERVIEPPAGDGAEGADRSPDREVTEAYTALAGTMVRSGPLTGTPVGAGEGESVRAAVAWLEAGGHGEGAVTYRLRDWLISRQRYWGTPIPVVYCDACGTVPVPDEDLPVLLPDDVDFGTRGENPLKTHPTWSRTECPKCAGPARRETDTMDTFVDSSWYQYRYLNPEYHEGPFDPDRLAWLPVDHYTGGIEHAVLHLLYTRFWTKVLRDMGMVDFDEPMARLFNQGIILGPDSKRMSKSRGNVIDPDDLVGRYGADTVRCFLMFLGPWDQGGPWSARGIEGVARWFGRIRDLCPAASEGEPGGAPDGADRDLQRKLHQTIRQVTEDLDAFRFNTAISRLMELTTALARAREELGGSDAWQEAWRVFVRLLAPFAPHLAEEMWERSGGPYSVHRQEWPRHVEELAAEESVEIAIQVNGKLRDTITVPAGGDRDLLEDRALASEKVQRYLEGRAPKRVIVVPGRLVNLVI